MAGQLASCTAAFNGLQLDIDRIRADNDARTEVRRKAGLIIHTGGELSHRDGWTVVLCQVPLELSKCTCHAANPTAAMKAAWQSDARERYGLADEQLETVEAHLQQAVAQAQHSQAEDIRKQGLLGKKWTNADIQHLLGGHAPQTRQ